MSETKTYSNILKTTFLFGFVQIIVIFAKVGINKIVAVLLGAEGIGLIGIYNSTIDLLKNGCGLGLSQSAVRDISEANNCGDDARFSQIISYIKRIIKYTGLFGCLITIILSPWLSSWTLGDKTYTWAFIMLSVAVGINILVDGQLAILKGMRQLKSLAKASIIGAIAGIIIAVPIYYYFRKSGIVPSLILTATVTLFFSNYYVKKLKYTKVNLPFIDTIKIASPMIKMGIALMLVTFLINIVSLIISAYIRAHGGIEEVGFYNAGVMIMSGYFGVIITALTTDYYPRISAINRDNKALTEELNKQSAVSLVLSCPLIVMFLLLLPFFVKFFFTNSFSPTIDFVRYGIFGTLITICSNQVSMILIAKYQIKILTFIEITYRIIQIGLNIIMYKYFGLIGTGLALTIMGIIHMTMMGIAVYKLYDIYYNKFFAGIAFFTMTFAISAVLISGLNSGFTKFSFGILLSILALIYSLIISKKYFGINILNSIKQRLY